MANLSTLKLREDCWEWWNELDYETKEELLIEIYAKQHSIIIE
jgi:hypothetical protein